MPDQDLNFEFNLVCWLLRGGVDFILGLFVYVSLGIKFDCLRNLLNGRAHAVGFIVKVFSKIVYAKRALFNPHKYSLVAGEGLITGF